MKYIDLRHQLVLWKKSEFMLDNIAFTSDFCEALVNEGLFNVDMMGEVMVSVWMQLYRSIIK